MESTVDAYVTATEHHLLQGTTSLAPTAVSASSADLLRFLEGYRDAEASDRIRARLVGAHLEGPYLSPRKAGAHAPECLRDPDPDEYEGLVARFPFLKRMTIAPELPGAFVLGDYLKAHGINASIGHSDASSAMVSVAAGHGFTSVTHLYNAMSSVGEREGRKQGGVVEAALLDDRLTAEVIADLRHVPSDLLRLAFKNKGRDRMALVSDCLAPAGMPAGRYRLGAGGAATEIDVRDYAFVAGTDKLAGSLVSSIDLLRNAVSAGIPLADAVTMLTGTPARLLGMADRIGSLNPGMAGDVVVLDRDLGVAHVVCKGVIIR
jgi:N-acetylglucosamine-6-phosphate deacetylase